MQWQRRTAIYPQHGLGRHKAGGSCVSVEKSIRQLRILRRVFHLTSGILLRRHRPRRARLESSFDVRSMRYRPPRYLALACRDFACDDADAPGAGDE